MWEDHAFLHQSSDMCIIPTQCPGSEMISFGQPQIGQVELAQVS